MVKHASLAGLLIACAALAACGEPVDQKALDNRPAEPPPPAKIQAAASAPVAALSTLEICVNAANSVTTAVNTCYETEAKARESAVQQYLEAAAKHLAKLQADTAAITPSQTAWTAYRDAYCNAVQDMWKDGTIRTAKTLACRADLAADRTHQLWHDYLTYPDSAPPDLPEPVRK